MALALNKHKNMCAKDQWLDNSPEEQQIVEISAELEKMKDTKIKLAKVFNAKGTIKGKTNKQVNQKGSKKNPPKQKNDNKYAWEKVPPKQVKKQMEKMNKKLRTSVSGITHGQNMTQKEREIMDDDFTIS